MTTDEIADGILACPKNADHPAPFLIALTLQNEPQQPNGALERDAECAFSLAWIDEELQVKYRLNQGNAIFALQDRHDTFTRIARPLIAPTGES